MTPAMFTSITPSITLSFIVTGLLAQQGRADVPLYGQCGYLEGVPWGGETQCVAGAVCTRLGAYYAQCLPATSGTTTNTPSPTPPITTTTATSPTASTQAAPIIVLPLGDSITWGIGSSDGNSYRKELKEELLKDSVTIDYIGTLKNGNMEDNDNQGHSGATIIQISGYAETALKQQPEVGQVFNSYTDRCWVNNIALHCKVVTLMAGTNDIGQNQDLANAPTRLTTLVDKILTASPNATVLVASANVDSYNARLEAAIKAKISAGQHVVWVSMSALTNSDLSDGIHPGAGGYIKMGAAWHAGWVSAKAKGWIR
ncbi:lipolytic enzyme [Ephemerocybe angulata]|uniref:Lipolytic enzyme n=1 Tax=Ephemerocybe angulata TaxID=980116 RepID=A0A8H6HGQ1_9AGAR|nr:lipolytic enzyme [Tulosesus angulatus]